MKYTTYKIPELDLSIGFSDDGTLVRVQKLEAPKEICYQRMIDLNTGAKRLPHELLLVLSTYFERLHIKGQSTLTLANIQREE